MQIDLRTLRPNPTRDFTIDPLDPEAIAKLKPSITDYGWWGGVVCRHGPDGTYEIAAGHHRIQAAIELGMIEADIVVRPQISDEEMIRIYATENATQRGNSTTSVAGSVASAIKHLAKGILTGEGLSHEFMSKARLPWIQGHLLSEEGVGRDAVVRFLDKIPGITNSTVDTQLANLKASGDYARLIAEVAQKVAEERQRAQEAEEAAEQERQQRLKEELEAQARRLEAEQRQHEAQEAARQAREEAERQRQERRAQEAAQAQQQAQREAEQAAQRRREAEAVRATAQTERVKKEQAHTKAQQAKTVAAKRERTFDFEGVAAVLKNDYQIATFREVVTGEGIRPYLAVADQADLARQLVAYAASLPKPAELTSTFIRQNLVNIFLGIKEQARAEAKTEHEALLRADRVQRALHLQEEFCRYARAMASAAKRIDTLWKEWPVGEDFPRFPPLLSTVQSVKKEVDKLVDRLAT